MANRVAEFLISLSKDPAAMATFAQDPDLLLADAGLTEEEKEAVRSADRGSIYRHLGSGGGELAWVIASSQSPPPGSQIQTPPPTPPPDTGPPPSPPGPPPTPPPGSPPGTPPGQGAAAAF